MSAVAIQTSDTDAICEQAIALHRADRLADAAVVYQRALAFDPDHGRSLHMSGMLAIQRNQTARGIWQLERALATGYRSAALLQHYGVVKQREGDLATATASFHAGLALDPMSGELWFNLGVVERQAGRLRNATEAFGRAAPLLRQAFAEYALGQTLQAAGRPAEAARAFAQVLALDPHHAAAALDAGVIAHQAGDFDGAAALYHRALSSDPMLLAARLNLTALQQERGDSEGAAAGYRAILADCPDSIAALNNLGATLRRLGDAAQAEALFRRVLVLDPFHAEACDNLTSLLRDTGRVADAMTLHRSRCTAHPGEARCWMDLARLQSQIGESRQSDQTLELALAREPALAEAYCLLGDHAQCNRQWAVADSYYRQSALLSPDRPEPQIGLALTALKSGDGATALAACDALLARDQFDQCAIAYRTLALRQCRREAEADWLSDPDGLVTTIPIDIAASDLADLAQELRDIRHRATAPAGQSIRGGTQTTNDLFAEPTPGIQCFRRLLDSSLSNYLAARSGPDKHPFFAARPERLQYHSWSVVLQDAGFHVPHIHPGGCISGVFYVAVPPLDPSDDAGSLEIGRPGLDVPLPEQPKTRLIQPVPGRLVLFPSYLWHGTIPFSGPGDRITIAFDVRNGPRPLRSGRW